MDEDVDMMAIRAGEDLPNHSFGESPQVCAVDLLGPAEDGFKGLPSGDMPIDEIVAIDTPQSWVGEI